MQKSLQDKIGGKRFLIILDVVWIEDGEKTEWDKLAISLSSGAEGSIVMVTTRNQTTSRMMAKVPDWQHELGCLSKADSWSLFEKFAFAEGREGGDKRELEPIGMEIVEKCKGLPLAVKTLGSLMWSKSSASDWERVKRSDIWQLQVNDILPALKLSYDNLLPHLKRCFAYCCLFPKGYEMEMDDLILLWMSNGLIPLSGADDLYARGEEIFKSLVWRSFFLFVEEKYKMHDLMHDLARYVMRHDCLITDPGKESITPDEVLHLSSSRPDFLFLHYDPEKLRSLRSIFIFTKEYEESFSHIFDHVYLRVLYLVGINLTALPESICKLKYLKYLNLSRSMIEVLPKSIICLQNLQMLLIEGCWKLHKLPEGMRYMKNLQHLNNKVCLSLRYLPVGIKELTRLRRLSNFPVDDNNGSKIGELGDLNLLEGELLISGLENVESLSEAKNANLKCKRNLLVLKLEWRHEYFDKCIPERIASDDEVLEGLEPNPNLKELEIFYCIGKIASLSWMVKLQNLVKITFDLCNNCEQIPSLGKLPSLKAIILQRMDSLKCFDVGDDTKSGDNVMFPVLQELIIEYCPSLIFLPRNFPNLKTLRLEQCKSLRSLPNEIQSFKDLNKLTIDGCEFLSRRYEEEIGVDWPKIAHIPFIHID